MLTIIEEPVEDENELRGNAERITMQMARGSSAGGGFRSSSTMALSRSGTPQLQRARLSGAQKQTDPLVKVNLNVMGVPVTKAPLQGILQPGILQNVREAISATDFPVDQVPSTPSLSTSKNSTPNGVNREADKTALTKLVRRKRERRHKQKVQFRATFPASMQPLEEASFSLPAAVPFPVPVCMPSYILKSKKDCQLRKARLGGMGGDAVVSSFAEESGSEKEFIDLKANKHLAVKTSEHKAFERLHSTETVDALIMSEDLSEIRGKVTFAVSQVRPTVLKHILLRNKLVDGHIQLNMLPKQNLVGLVMSSSQATRELLRGLMFQQKGGGNKCLDGNGVESLSQYKSISECEPTPRPVSDTFNQSVVAGPGLFHRNRFPPGNTTLERLTWWERQADNICKDYEEMMSLRMKAKNKRDLDNGSIVHGLTNPNPGVKTQGDQRFERGSTSNTTMSQAESRQRKVEAMQLASEAEAELSQAINAAKNAKVRFEGLSRSTPPTRDHISREGARSAAGIPPTSFSTTGQRIDTVIRAVGSRSSWPRTRADKRCSSQLSERGQDDEFADFVDEGESYSRPATETGVRNRSASADLAAMNLSVGRSPLRHRARAEDRERGLLSTSKFLGSGAFLPEYVVKNNFAGGRRGFCIKAGLPYEVNTCDHVKELLVERRSQHAEDESELPENLLALKNLGTKRWRQGYERGITEFVPGMAKMQNPLKQIHPRDSKIFDEWSFGEEQLGPPLVSLTDTNLEKSEDRKKGLLKPMSPKYTLHILGESQYKDTNCYSFGSVLHPKNDLVRCVREFVFVVGVAVLVECVMFVFLCVCDVCVCLAERRDGL
jgi:hypothetical protein